MIQKKFLPYIVISVLLFIGIVRTVFADNASSSAAASSSAQQSDNSQQIQNLQSEIQSLQSKISDLHGQEHTLSSQIKVMDSQITLTQDRIDATKQQIIQAQDDIAVTTKRITMLNNSLDGLTKVLLNRIKATYMIGSTQQMQILLTSSNATDFFTRTNYLRAAQAHDKQLVYDTVSAKNDYANEQSILVQKKKNIENLQNQLVSYAQEINQEKLAKQTLLTQTQGSEANYQHLLSQAQSELAGFSNFVANQGGAGILSGQTSCDSWGCYYNQRDSQWGNILINGQSGYTVAGYGCLITSIAMVLSHMGHTEVMPSDIANSGNGNFAVGTAMLAKAITVKGVSLNRVGTSLDAGLQSGPVIVGIYAYGGTHFVVLKSGSNGSYTMNDPYIANGHDISFTDHYSLGSIFEEDKVVLQ